MGAGADRVMAPGARALSLTERMALGRCVTKSRVLRCGDDPGLFKCASI